MALSGPEEVVFPGGGRQLHGFLRKPEGARPLPAVVWNQGSGKRPGSQPAWAAFYTAHLSSLFRTARTRPLWERLHPGSGDAAPRGMRAQRRVELQQAEADDVVAALSYLKSLPFVDPAPIAIRGCPSGGRSARRRAPSRLWCRLLLAPCRGS